MFVIASLHRYTLVDVVVCIMGQTTNHANRAIEQVLLNDKDVVHEVDFTSLIDSTRSLTTATTCVTK